MNDNRNGRKAAGSGGDGFDWSQFDRLFDELFPNALPGGKSDSFRRIGRFVRDVVEGAAPANRETAGARSEKSDSVLFRPEVTETERFVKVRIPIPHSIDPRKLQLFVDGTTLKIEGPLGNKQTVRLPAPVGVRTGHAAFRDGSLHVRLRKRSGPGYREIYVEYP
ncbi:Hsp20/alpha crystallin family protein [Paenibacillus flagellatus]|nr:Hsp20/alpha crystallin family protein [Paenibacillus flagellatus]